jgi:hypothetical protein
MEGIMKPILACLLGISVLIFACDQLVGPTGPQGPEGPQGPAGPSSEQDKQIRLPFTGGSWGADTTGWITSAQIYRFSILNYVNVDSLTFVAKMVGGTNGETYAMARLYNLTDSVFIENSLIQTTSPQWIWVESGNLYDNMPEKEIDLAIHLQESKEGDVAMCCEYLYVYRQ